MSKIPQKYDTQISKVVAELREHGDLFFVSEKGHGKTVACENLATEIIKRSNNKLIVFETFPKWSREFGNASFMEIPSNWIVETSKIMNVEKAWIQHERSFTVLHGDLISQFLRENQHCIFLISNEDIEKIAFFEYSIIYRFYRRQYDLLRKGYNLDRHYYFVLEEAQNSLDSKILSSRLFRRYRKLFSEARNMNLHWILISQRMQDLSTYFRARCSLAIGKIGLDDYDLKLRRLLKPINNGKQVLELDRGSFFFSSINDIVSFPKFQPSKPNEFKYTVKSKPQKKGLIQKIRDVLNRPIISVEETEEDNYINIDRDEDDLGVTFEDEDLIEDDLFGDD